MRRHQLLEIHDQPWCPESVREGATDYLHVVADVGRQYARVAPKLNHAVRATATTRIVDLCSGGGGPWRTLQPHVRGRDGSSIPVVLTDLFPSDGAARRQRGGDHVQYARTPVDATAVPADLTGFRTLFTAFHHFPPSPAMLILRDAVNHGQGIAVFEQTHRSLGAMALMLVLPAIAFFVAPFVRPFRWSRLFWTYVVPLLPVVLCIDGIISCLRTYTVDELRIMALAVDPEQRYVWDAGRVASPLSPIGVTYLIGVPKGAGAGDAPLAGSADAEVT